jgi:predicted DNA-binding transcriptional regulator AlpA
MTLAFEEKLLTTKETAARLGVAPVTLDKWRSTKKYSLAYVKIGGRVAYRESDVTAFIESRRVVPGELTAKRKRRK